MIESLSYDYCVLDNVNLSISESPVYAVLQYEYGPSFARRWKKEMTVHNHPPPEVQHDRHSDSHNQVHTGDSTVDQGSSGGRNVIGHVPNAGKGIRKTPIGRHSQESYPIHKAR